MTMMISNTIIAFESKVAAVDAMSLQFNDLALYKQDKDHNDGYRCKYG